MLRATVSQSKPPTQCRKTILPYKGAVLESNRAAQITSEKPTALYDRRNQDVERSEIERVRTRILKHNLLCFILSSQPFPNR